MLRKGRLMSNGGEVDAVQFRRAVQEALVDLLKPIVEICLSNGMVSGDVEMAVQAAFVSVAGGEAIDELEVASKTGLDVEQVGHFAGRKFYDDSTDDRPALVAILSAWERQQEYTGAYGVPLDLPLTGSGDEVSFASLVANVGGGIGTEEALNSLVRMKRVKYIDEYTVRHVWNFVVCSTEDIDFALHIRRAFKRLGHTIQNNFSAGEDGFKQLEQCQYSDVPLTKSQYEEFNLRLREKVEELFRWSDSWLGAAGKTASRKSTEASAGASAKIWPGIGVYQFVDEPEDAPGNASRVTGH